MAVTERPLAPGLRLNQWSVIRSEWIKFRSLRSTTITLLVSAVLSVGISALITGQLGTHPGRIDSDFDAASDQPRRHPLQPAGRSASSVCSA